MTESWFVGNLLNSSTITERYDAKGSNQSLQRQASKGLRVFNQDKG